MKPHHYHTLHALTVLVAALLALSTIADPSLATKKNKKKNDKTTTAPAKDDEKPFKNVIKDMTIHEDLFRVYTKTNENKMLIKVMPNQLRTMFLFSPTLDQALDEHNFYDAQMLPKFPIVFHRIGKSIQLVQKNTMYRTNKSTPKDKTATRSFTKEILTAAKLQSKPHPKQNSLLIDATKLFNTNLPNIARTLSQVYRPTTYHFDKNKNGPIRIEVFPTNILFNVRLHFTTNDPKSFSTTLPDPRSVPLLVKYDLAPLQQTDYAPRVANDRVEHFHTVQQDFRSDHDSNPLLRNIAR